MLCSGHKNQGHSSPVQISECHFTHFQIFLKEFLPLGSEFRKRHSLFICFFSSSFLPVFFFFFVPICHFSLSFELFGARSYITLLWSYLACRGVSQNLCFLISWLNCTALRKHAVYFLFTFCTPHPPLPVLL